MGGIQSAIVCWGYLNNMGGHSIGDRLLGVLALRDTDDTGPAFSLSIDQGTSITVKLQLHNRNL